MYTWSRSTSNSLTIYVAILLCLPLPSPLEFIRTFVCCFPMLVVSRFCGGDFVKMGEKKRKIKVEKAHQTKTRRRTRRRRELRQHQHTHISIFFRLPYTLPVPKKRLLLLIIEKVFCCWAWAWCWLWMVRNEKTTEGTKSKKKSRKYCVLKFSSWIMKHCWCWCCVRWRSNWEVDGLMEKKANRVVNLKWFSLTSSLPFCLDYLESNLDLVTPADESFSISFYVPVRL